MARPKFEDISDADAKQLIQSAPRAPDKPATPLTEQTPPMEVDDGAPNPTNVQRQPADAAPLDPMRGTAKLAPEIDSLQKGFEEAEARQAADRLKTPEQREAEAAAAQEKKDAEEAAKAAPVDKKDDTTAAAVAPVGTAATDQTITNVEEELKNPHLKARDKKRYTELLSSLKSERTARQEHEAKVKELEAKATAPTKADDAELKKLRDELQATADENLKYKRKFGLESDPEIAKRYDEPVKQAEEGITKILEGYQLGKPTMELIAKEGGFAAFSKSSRLFAFVQEVDDPANPGKKIQQRIQKSAADLTREWLNAMAPGDAEEIRSKMSAQFGARDAKSRFITEESAKASEYFKQKSEAESKQSTEQQAAAKQIADEYNKWTDETSAKTDWMKEQEVPAGATPEQKASIEASNAFAKDVKGFLKKPPATREEYQAMVYDAAEARHLRRTASTKDARIKELEAQVGRLQAGSSTTPKKGSIMPGAPGAGAPAKEKKFDPMKDDVTDNLVRDFEKTLAGRG